MKKIQLYLICFLSWFLILSSCKQESLETIYSEIDGKAYLEDMNSAMNARKATRLILENKLEQVSTENILTIADSLITQDLEWRKMYFTAFSTAINQLNEQQKKSTGPSLFSFFIRNPSMYKSQIAQLTLENSDLLLELIAEQVSEATHDEQITANSIINVTLGYCRGCTHQEMDFIVSYVRLAEKLITD